MAKPYAVVFFIGQDSYSEIPSNWLLNNEPEGKRTIKCKWPPSFAKNLQQLLKQRVEPNDDWPIHEVTILRYCDTLAAARNAAEDSEYESSTERPLGRGLRLKRPTAVAVNLKNNTVFDSSDEDSNDKTTKAASQMPMMPTIPEIETQRKIPFVEKISSSLHKINEINDNQHFEDKSRITGSGCYKNNENGVPSDLEIDADDDDNRFNVINEKLSKCLRLLGALTIDVKDLKQRTAITNFGDACDVNSEIALQIKKDLPLKSRAEVNAFEEKLSNSPDYRRQFVRSVNQIGGANGKDYTERVLNAIFSQSFATDNTWEGKKTKYKVNKLNLINICEEVILKKFCTWDSAEFSKAGTNWFRLGNQRAGQQPKQVEKKTNPQNKITISHDKN